MIRLTYGRYHTFIRHTYHRYRNYLSTYNFFAIQNVRFFYEQRLLYFIEHSYIDPRVLTSLVILASKTERKVWNILSKYSVKDLW